MTNHLKTIEKTDDKLRVANYMVLFDGQDLEGETFRPDTDFESSYTKTGTLYVDWEHGIAPEGDGPKRDDVLGVVDWKTAERDENGLWVERVLDRRAAYMEFIEPLIEEGLVGTSSEATDGAKVEDGIIKKWPLKRDALTVMPAEPRMLSENAVQAIKALSDQFPTLKSLLPESGETASEAETETDEVDKQPKQVKVKETSTMTEEKEVLEEEIQEETSQKAVDYTSEIKTMGEQMELIGKKVEEIFDRMENEPAHRDSGYYSPMGGENDKQAKSFGDFVLAVRRNDTRRLKSIYKTAMEEERGAYGGYLVPEEFHNQLIMAAADQAVIRPRATVINVATDAGKVPALDQATAPTAGVGDTAFAGGVTADWTAEGSSGSETNPSFKQIEYNVKKIAAYASVNNELLQDSAQSIEGILSRLFGVAIVGLEEHAFLRGDGAGSPLGLLNAGAAIGIDPDSNDVFGLADAVEILSRFRSFGGQALWVGHRSIMPDLGGTGWSVDTGGVDYVQPREGMPPNLLGYPLIWSEHMPQADSTNPMLVDPTVYAIFDRSGPALAFSEHSAFTSDQGQFRITKRLDGQPLLSSAITLADPSGSYTVSPIVYFND